MPDSPRNPIVTNVRNDDDVRGCLMRFAAAEALKDKKGALELSRKKQKDALGREIKKENKP